MTRRRWRPRTPFSRCSRRSTATAAQTTPTTCGRSTTRSRRATSSRSSASHEPRVASRRGVLVQGGDRGARPGASPRRPRRLRRVPGARPLEPRRGALPARALRRGDRRPRGVAGALPAARSRMVAYPLEKLGRSTGCAATWRSRAPRTRRRSAVRGRGRLQGLVPRCGACAGGRRRRARRGAAARGPRARVGPGMNQVQRSRRRLVALARGDRRSRPACRTRHRKPVAGATTLHSRKHWSCVRWRPRQPDGPRAPRGVGAIWSEIQNPAGQARASLVGRSSRATTSPPDAPRRSSRSVREGRPRGAGARPSPHQCPAAGRQDARPLPGPAVRRAGAARRVAVEQGARPAQAPRRAARPADPAGRPDGGALARAGTRPARQPPLGRTQHRPPVLDPDKRYDQEHFVVADKNAVRLELANLSIDVEGFLEAPRRPSCSAGRGARGGSRPPPRPPTAATSSRRTRTRTGRCRCARRRGRVYGRGAGARRGGARGDADATTRYSCASSSATRTTSPPTSGWSALAAAGRHGEARASTAVLCRMDEIGVESAPFPAASLSRRRQAGRQER